MKLEDLKKAYPQKIDPTKPFAPAVLKARTFGSLFAGLMVASVLVVVFPILGNIAAPFLCWNGSKFISASDVYSYKPGQVGVSEHWGCLDPATQTVIDQSILTLLICFIIYSLIIFVLMTIRAMIKAHLAKKDGGKGIGSSGGASA